MQVSKRITDLRIQNNLSQKQIAKMLGVAQSTYSYYESGKISVPIEQLVALAKFYDVDMNFICGITKIEDFFPTIY